MNHNNRQFPPPGRQGQRMPGSGGPPWGSYQPTHYPPQYPQSQRTYPVVSSMPPMRPPQPPGAHSHNQHQHSHHAPPRLPTYQTDAIPGAGYPITSRPAPTQVPTSAIPSIQQFPPIPRQQLNRPTTTPQPVVIKSENPFVVRVKLAGVPLDQGGIPRSPAREDSKDKRPAPLRASARTPKRKRQSYAEDLEDTDSDVSDENETSSRRRIKKGTHLDDGGPSTPKKKSRLSGNNKKGKGTPPPDSIDAAAGPQASPQQPVTDQLALTAAPAAAFDVNQIDAPPPGVLPSLWYSRECVLHIFVIEKILGWKTRPVVKLNFASPETPDPDSSGHHHKKHGQHLDPVKAHALSTKAITNNITDARKRMEISRINPTHCPVVVTIAAAKEAALSRKKGTRPQFALSPHKENEREEVFLVKWRGRSHIHCSWERRRDLEKFDPTNTARGKIKRYMQSQEAAMGKNWKQVLEEGRATSAHGHHSLPGTKQEDGEDNKAPIEEEEFFSPECAEVERILACDESEMDMNVLARQRALNMKAEREALRRREAEEETEAQRLETGKCLEGKVSSDQTISNSNGEAQNMTSATAPSILVGDGGGTTAAAGDSEEEAWDPEDNVRYVVKWKGLQFSEITWEYWRDIKRDCVDQAEDFWHRQRAPEMDEVKSIISRPHPHVRDFKKLSESPLFGLSRRERPVADLGDGLDLNGEDADNDKESSAQSSSLRLRGYQLEGVNWLLWNWWNRRSCILADEMGLGKTIQSVCFLDQLQRLPATQVRGPFLVVAPLSLINQWQSESAAWAPDMNVILYHGSADARDFLVKQEFFYTDQFVPKSIAVKLKRQHITKFHLLITTYEVVLKDIAVLSKIRWKALIVDEAHRLKNDKARLFVELATVPRDFCLLLTGTPLQNSTEELWSLLNFSNPTSFASKDAFVEQFGQLQSSEQVSDLHSVLKPYLLRRVKEDVEKSLPPKEETILEVTLTPIQKTYYKAIYERNTAFLFKGAKPSNAPSLMNIMMELRKCSNHPFLIRGAEERILADASALERHSQQEGRKDEAGAVSQPAVDHLKIYADQLVKSSGKMVLLEKLLPKLHSGGHKVLIFSQMVRVLDLLEEFLRMKRYRYERLDGSTSSSSRSAAVQRFHRKSCQRFIMLLSTRAGGLGLNLTAADTVIIFDSDWNPQNDLQAMARAHRIGQTRSVRVYRLLTSKTYEMHMFHSASMKLGLDRAVLAHQRQHGTDDSDGKTAKTKSDREMQAKEIDELLKKGAYDVFRDDDDNEAQKFMETDIDQLLEQSSRKVTYGATTSSSISSGLGSFSKASFVASTGDGDGKDIDLDDPDFWEKAVGLEAPAENVADADSNVLLDSDKKRSRKQVQVFDPYAAYAEAEQRKKDKIAQKIKQEKDEKERLRQEKKKKKREEKEKKRRAREEAREAREKLPSHHTLQKKSESDAERLSNKDRKAVKEVRTKKLKKAERRRALRKAEKEDPVLERIKQAWETPQRNRATSAALRFGFGRFSKIRHESNLTSLPIQDIEVFVRSYIYQLGLQAAVSVLSRLRNVDISDITVNNVHGILHQMLVTCVGAIDSRDRDWILSAIMSALKLHSEVKEQRRSLRIPLTLLEPAFLSELRAGGAIRALRRFSFLSRLNAHIEDALDSVLSGLGHEELGKRGCPTKDLSTLDSDLKARHVSTEELSHVLGIHLRHHNSRYSLPAPWWDRSCDLALIIGTFVHGLGNYEAMRNDDDLPFGKKIKEYVEFDGTSAQSFARFDAAAKAVRRVFDSALSSAKSKAQDQAHAAVVAAVAASKLAEKSERDESKHSKAEISTNGTKRPSDVVVLLAAEKSSGADGPKFVESKTFDNNKSSTEADDTDVVTLQRLFECILSAARSVTHDSDLKVGGPNGDGKQTSIHGASTSKGNDTSDLCVNQLLAHHRLPMPDARILDRRLCWLVDNLEVIKLSSRSEVRESKVPENFRRRNNTTETIAAKSVINRYAVSAVLANREMERGSLSATFRDKVELFEEKGRSCPVVGFRGFLCGTYHRSLDDGTDFSLGAASTDLAGIASGADVSRYQRSEGVPVLFTRYSVCALVHADRATVENMLTVEKEVIGNQKEESLPSQAVGEFPFPTQYPPKADALKLKSEVPVPPLLRDNHQLRAGLCVALLIHGFPAISREKWREVDLSLRQMLQRSNCVLSDDAERTEVGNRERLFSVDKFLVAARNLSGTQHICDGDVARAYIEDTFLPHCLLLCVKGPDVKSAEIRGLSFDTGSAVFSFGEPSPFDVKREERGNTVYSLDFERGSCLPDPCLPLSLHSEESFAYAAAILRRTKLSRAIRFLVGGGVAAETLVSFLKGPLMRSNLDGLPLWWCPWIHDLAVLVHAAKYGLFSILRDFREQKKLKEIHSVFEISAIERHIYATFIEGNSGDEYAIPGSLLRKSSPVELNAWIKSHAQQFPVASVLEKRISLICGHMTFSASLPKNSTGSDFFVYDDIAMFDYGGWPKN